MPTLLDEKSPLSERRRPAWQLEFFIRSGNRGECVYQLYGGGGGQCVLQSVAEHTAKLTWCLFSVAINHLSNFKNKDHSFHKKKPTLSKLQQPPPPSFLFPRPLRRITPSWTTVPPFIRPDSTKRPVRIPRIVTSSFYKPRGQEKQIEPISGVEITLKTTTANVEMYYLHPPNPIYFMHILPSKLNTACSLFGKSL